MSQADIFEGLSGKDEQQQALTEQTEAGKKAGQAAVKLQQESNPLTEEQQEIKTQLAGADIGRRAITEMETSQRMAAARAGETLEANLGRINELDRLAPSAKGNFQRIGMAFEKSVLESQNDYLKKQEPEGKFVDPYQFPVVPIVNDEGGTVGYTRVNAQALGGRPRAIPQAMLDKRGEFRVKQKEGTNIHGPALMFDGSTPPEDIVEVLNSDTVAERSVAAKRLIDETATVFEQGRTVPPSRLVHHAKGLVRELGVTAMYTLGELVDLADFLGETAQELAYSDEFLDDYNNRFTFRGLFPESMMRRDENGKITGDVDWGKWFKDNPRSTEGQFNEWYDKTADAVFQGVSQVAVLATAMLSPGKKAKAVKGAVTGKKLNKFKDLIPIISRGKNVPAQIAMGFMQKERIIDAYLEQGMTYEEARKNALIDSTGIVITSMVTGKLTEKLGNKLLSNPHVREKMLEASRYKAMDVLMAGTEEAFQEALDEIFFQVVQAGLDRLDLYGNREDNPWIADLEQVLLGAAGGFGGGAFAGSLRVVGQSNAITANMRNENVSEIGQPALGPSGEVLLPVPGGKDKGPDDDGPGGPPAATITAENKKEFERLYRRAMARKIFEDSVEERLNPEERVSVTRQAMYALRTAFEQRNHDALMFGNPDQVVESGPRKGQRKIDMVAANIDMAYAVAGREPPSKTTGESRTNEKSLRPVEGNSRKDWQRAGLGWMVKGLNSDERQAFVEAAVESVQRHEQRVADMDAIAEQRLQQRMADAGYVSVEEENRIRQEAERQVEERRGRLQQAVGAEPPKPSEFVGVREDLGTAEQLVAAAMQVASPETTDTLRTSEVEKADGTTETRSTVARTDRNMEFQMEELSLLVAENGQEIVNPPNSDMGNLQKAAASRNVAVVFVRPKPGSNKIRALRDRETGIILIDADLDTNAATTAVTAHEMIHTLQFESKASYQTLLKNFARLDPESLTDAARTFMQRSENNARFKQMLEEGISPTAAADVESAGTMQFTDADIAQILRADGQLAYEVLPYAVELLVQQGSASQIKMFQRAVAGQLPNRLQRFLGRLKDFLSNLSQGVGKAWRDSGKWQALFTALDQGLKADIGPIDVNQLRAEGVKETIKSVEAGDDDAASETRAVSADIAAGNQILDALVNFEPEPGPTMGGPTATKFKERQVLPRIVGARNMSQERLSRVVRAARSRASRMRAVGIAMQSRARRMLQGGAAVEGTVEAGKAAAIAGQFAGEPQTAPELMKTLAQDMLEMGVDVTESLPAVLRFAIDLGMPRSEAEQMLAQAKAQGLVQNYAVLLNATPFDQMIREGLMSIEAEEIADPGSEFAREMDESIMMPRTGRANSYGPSVSANDAESVRQISEDVERAGGVFFVGEQSGGYGSVGGEKHSLSLVRAIDDYYNAVLDRQEGIGTFSDQQIETMAKVLERHKEASKTLLKEQTRTSQFVQGKIKQHVKKLQAQGHGPLELFSKPANPQAGDIYVNVGMQRIEIYVDDGSGTVDSRPLIETYETDYERSTGKFKGSVINPPNAVRAKRERVRKQGRMLVPDYAAVMNSHSMVIPPHMSGVHRVPMIQAKLEISGDAVEVGSQHMSFEMGFTSSRFIKNTQTGNNDFELNDGYTNNPIMPVGQVAGTPDVSFATTFPHLGRLIGYGIEQSLFRVARFNPFAVMVTGGSPISFGRARSYSTFHQMVAAYIEDQTGVPMMNKAGSQGLSSLTLQFAQLVDANNNSIYEMRSGLEEPVTQGGVWSNILSDSLDKSEGFAKTPLGLSPSEFRKFASQTPWSSLTEEQQNHVIDNYFGMVADTFTSQSGGRVYTTFHSERNLAPTRAPQVPGAKDITGDLLPAVGSAAMRVATDPTDSVYDRTGMPWMVFGPMGGGMVQRTAKDISARTSHTHNNMLRITVPPGSIDMRPSNMKKDGSFNDEIYLKSVGPDGIDFTGTRLAQAFGSALARAKKSHPTRMSVNEFVGAQWDTIQERYRRYFEVNDEGSAPDGTTQLRTVEMVQKENEYRQEYDRRRFTGGAAYIKAWADPDVGAALRDFPSAETVVSNAILDVLNKDGRLTNGANNNGGYRLSVLETEVNDQHEVNIDRISAIDGGMMRLALIVDYAKSVIAQGQSGQGPVDVSLDGFRQYLFQNDVKDMIRKTLDQQWSRLNNLDRTQIQGLLTDMNEPPPGGYQQDGLPSGDMGTLRGYIVSVLTDRIYKQFRSEYRTLIDQSMEHLDFAMVLMQGLDPSMSFDAVEFLMKRHKQPGFQTKAINFVPDQYSAPSDVRSTKTDIKSLGVLEQATITPGVRRKSERDSDLSMGIVDPYELIETMADPDGTKAAISKWVGTDNKMLTPDGQIPLLLHMTREPGFRVVEGVTYLTDSHDVAKTYMPLRDLADGPHHGTKLGMYPMPFSDPEGDIASKPEPTDATHMGGVLTQIGHMQRLHQKDPGKHEDRPFLPEYGISRRSVELNVAVDEYVIPFDRETGERLDSEEITKQFKPSDKNRFASYKTFSDAVLQYEIANFKQQLEDAEGPTTSELDEMYRYHTCFNLAMDLLNSMTIEEQQNNYKGLVRRHSAIYKMKKKGDFKNREAAVQNLTGMRNPLPESVPENIKAKSPGQMGVRPEAQMFDAQILAYSIDDPAPVIEYFNKNKNALTNIRGAAIPMVGRMKKPLVMNANGKRWALLEPMQVDEDGNVTGENLPDDVLVEVAKGSWTSYMAAGQGKISVPSPKTAAEAKSFFRQLYAEPKALGNLDAYQHIRVSTDIIVKTAKKLGYDGVIFRNIDDLMGGHSRADTHMQIDAMRSVGLTQEQVEDLMPRNVNGLMLAPTEKAWKQAGVGNFYAPWQAEVQKRKQERRRPRDVYAVFSGKDVKAPTLNHTGIIDEQSRRIDESLVDPKEISKHLARLFRSKGDMPRKVFERKFSRDAEIKRYQIESSQRVAELRRALSKDVKTGDAKSKLMQIVDQALKSNDFSKLKPFPYTHAAAVAMRGSIDALTRKMINSGLLSSTLEKTFTENLGFYVHRSYRVFDDPNWAKNVPQDVRNRMRALLVSQYPGLSAAQIENKMEKLLHLGKGSGSVMDTLSAGESVLTDVLRKRNKKLNATLRQLWGEYTDPEINFTKSLQKMAAAFTQMKFLDDIADMRVSAGGKTVPMFYDPKDINIDPLATVEIPTDRARWGKLAGRKTTPELWDAIQQIDRGEIINQWWYRQYIRANAGVKWGKTVGSPMTHVRNLVGNIGFAIANGHLPFVGPKKSLQALVEIGKTMPLLQAGKAMALGKSPAERLKARRVAEKAYRELVEMGVVQSGNLNEVLQLLQEAATSRMTLDDLFQRMIDKGSAMAVAGKGLKAAKGLGSKINKLYMAEDDVWKIFAYHYELQRYNEAYAAKGQVPPPGLNQKVARIIRDTYPNYDMVPRFIRLLRQVPFMGTFVSFPSEVVRTAIARLQITAAELSNPVTRGIGLQRAAGQIAAYSLGSVAARGISSLFGVGWEEEEAIRKLVAPWSQNSPLIIMKDEKGKYKYVDLGYTDPHAMFLKPIMALVRGSTIEEALLGNSAAGQTGMFEEVMAPFFGEEILFGSLIEVTTGRTKTGRRVYGQGDPKLEKWKKVANHLFGDLAPGAYRQLAEIPYKAINGITDDYGKVYELPSHLASVGLGMRIEPMDVEQAFAFKARTFGRIEQELRGELTRVAGRAGTVSETELMATYETVNRNRLRNLQAFTEMVSHMQALGLDRRRIRDLLVAGGIAKKRVNAVIEGKHVPVKIDSDLLQRYVERPMSDDVPIRKEGEVRRRIAALRAAEQKAKGQ